MANICRTVIRKSNLNSPTFRWHVGLEMYISTTTTAGHGHRNLPARCAATLKGWRFALHIQNAPHSHGRTQTGSLAIAASHLFPAADAGLNPILYHHCVHGNSFCFIFWSLYRKRRSRPIERINSRTEQYATINSF